MKKIDEFAIKNIDKSTDVNSLLQNYETFEKEFIKEYVKSQLTILSIGLTNSSLRIAIAIFIAATFLSSILALSAGNIQKLGFWDFIYFSIPYIALFIISYSILWYKMHNDKTTDVIFRYQEIIIAIEDEKLTKTIIAEEDILSKE